MVSDINKYIEGESKFNKSLEDLRRLSILQDQANQASYIHSWQGLQLWFDILERIDSEITPMLKPEQVKELEQNRPLPLPTNINHKILGVTPPINIRRQLVNYHNTLNKLIIAKGLGFQIKEVRKSFILPQS